MVLLRLLVEDGAACAGQYNKHGMLSSYQLRPRKDATVIKKQGKLASFFHRVNSICHTHIWKHYNFNSQKCKEKMIKENKCYILPEIARAREKAAAGKGMV